MSEMGYLARRIHSTIALVRSGGLYARRTPPKTTRASMSAMKAKKNCYSLSARSLAFFG